MNIVLIKYNAGNIQSVLYALGRLGIDARVSDDPETIMKADKVIFPGVGEASTAMQYLRNHKLDNIIIELKQPVLGICLGMQLMCAYSEENDTACMGIFNEHIRLFRNPEGSSNPLKVPQIGWNNIYDLKTDLFAGVPENSFVYAVHSYYAALGSQAIAGCDYIQPYSAALHRDNFYGVQFHPEKSAAIGEKIIRNFVERIK